MPESKRRTPLHMNPWVIARKVMQGLSLLAFTIAIIATGVKRAPYPLSNALIRLSPLAMLAEMISSRTFLIGMTLSLVLLVSSLVVGRAWCGWLCPMGTLLDIFKFRKNKPGLHIPEKWRSVKYGFLIITLLSAVFSNLALLVFDPINIFTRTITLSILPALDQIITVFEKLLYSLPFLSTVVYRFDVWIRPAFLPVEPAVFQYSLLTGIFFTGIVLLNLAAERFWCRYLCPLGALLGIASRLTLVKRRVNENCAGCRFCESHCPTGTIDPQRNFESDPSECTLCMNCLESCQKRALTFNPKFGISPRREYDPDKRIFLNSLLTSVVLSVLFSIDWIRRYPRNHSLLPPGADINTFSSTCIRCGLCMKVCPTGGLQPSVAETGIEGVGTPVLVPRLGFCQFSCNACGQVCPVNAIPPLSLEEKQTVVIGKAYIDHDRCIAWSDHQTCIVCEEMCPLPQKAITLEKGTVTASDGKEVILSLPVVNREICVGCGICEQKCPVAGDAAIRVFVS